ncbi:MAG: histidine--tRNA ligase [Alphaproteobacteria bacterium]|nr:histidine--tRNA ligase [Alphaproteobacteria bacterium]
MAQAKLQPVRGTHDLLPADCRRHRAVTDATRAVAERYGYGEIATPIFEFTEVFSRPLGETTDVVTKEMYTFVDRGGDSLTLRPENTASVVRAVISNGLFNELPLKYHYAGPMFRYERPQKGRQRQFHQIGVELIGPSEPEADVEVIAMGADVLADLGLADRVTLEINSLGDPASRAAHRAALVAYLTPQAERLSPDSRARLARNPLRILDTKDEGDRRMLDGAPRLDQFLNSESTAFFAAVRRGLDRLRIAHAVNPRLVRGFDYYTHTAFEFVTEHLGAQGTVIGGGRYDGLVAQLGGPDTAAIGWAGGIERLAMLLAVEPPAPRAIALVPIGDDAEARAQELAHGLRRAGFVIDLGYRGNVRRRMKRANKIGAKAALIIGDTELAKGIATLRDLTTGDQSEVPLDGLAGALGAYR